MGRGYGPAPYADNLRWGGSKDIIRLNRSEYRLQFGRTQEYDLRQLNPVMLRSEYGVLPKIPNFYPGPVVKSLFGYQGEAPAGLQEQINRMYPWERVKGFR